MSKQDLAKLLECPSCFEYMFAPIYLCPAGHSMCKDCKSKVQTCPICRAPFIDGRSRNYNLENISVLISYPCPYEYNGCPEMIIFSDLNDHKKLCNFRPYTCIFKNDCNFEGPVEALKTHYRERHPNDLWVSSEYEGTWRNNRPKLESQIAFCHKEMFYYHRLLAEHGYMYWVCQFVGEKENASKFSYEISLDNGEGKVITLRDRCKSDLLSIKTLAFLGDCVGMEKRIFDSFVGEDESVRYRLTIESDI